MRVLVACEFSGIVKDAFAQYGHDAWSCDILPTERAGNHFQEDIRGVIGLSWDLMIAHPPCTYLTVSANKWMKPEYESRFPGRKKLREKAIDFFMLLMNAPIKKIAVENPIGIMSTRFRKPDQIIQPWMFGHGETKATCLWLKGLPVLVATHRKEDLFAQPEPEGRVQRLHLLPPSKDRWKERSRTYQGIAEAMAEQWGRP